MITDEQIDHLWYTRVGPPTLRHPLTEYDIRIFARAVLALQPAAPDVPEGCTPADAEMLRRANHELAEENNRLRQATSWLPRSYGGSTFDTRPLGLGPAATIRLHFSDAVEAERWFEHITDQLLEASKEKP